MPSLAEQDRPMGGGKGCAWHVNSGLTEACIANERIARHVTTHTRGERARDERERRRGRRGESTTSRREAREREEEREGR